MPPPIQSPRPKPGGEPVGTVIDARPAALVNGEAVSTGELLPLLNELAGADALREIVLGRRIEEALGAARLSISADDVAAERKVLLESLSDDEQTSLRLLDEMRARQKLGRVRFELMMRRNAGLRALVRKQSGPLSQPTASENSLMDQLSARLLRDAAVTIYDQALSESWAWRARPESESQ